MRSKSFLDTFLTGVDTALRTVLPPTQRSTLRPSPAQELKDIDLSTKQKQHVAGLMRVNHSGEVCAQALYQGQALTANLADVRQKMSEAAAEEIDHLAWCETRLKELGSHPSLLNPIWYAGSLFLGAIAGIAGDKISLGFVAETEKQVSTHLQKHLDNLPEKDIKTKAILERMKEDEEYHANTAIAAGAVELPLLVKQLMSMVSKLMTRSSYYI